MMIETNHGSMVPEKSCSASLLNTFSVHRRSLKNAFLQNRERRTNETKSLIEKNFETYFLKTYTEQGRKQAQRSLTQQHKYFSVSWILLGNLKEFLVLLQLSSYILQWSYAFSLPVL